MTDNNTIEYCLNALKDVGADKAQCVLIRNRKYEMNVESGEISLFRTTFDVVLSLVAIKDGKKGSTSINKINEEAIREAVTNVMELAETGERDEAFDISPHQVPKEFIYGDSEPDMDKMHDLLKGFVTKVKEIYPLVNIMESQLTFKHVIKYFANSNGVNFKESRGLYEFGCLFTSIDKEKSSSFNYTGCSMKKLEKELLELGTVRKLLKESIEQLDAIAMEGKFVGDIIITPDCLGDFIDYYIYTFLGDKALISGTSALKDKLNTLVASPKFTLTSNPISKDICEGYFITGDGFEAKNIKLIDKGVLKSFLLSLYGANKTKLKKADNSGGGYIIDAGEKTFEEMVGNIKKGIMVSRFSGGSPSSNGDFSGVAKNSYYIEDGEIKHSISETMITGNLLELMANIKDISMERVDFGSAILPWICMSGVTISGK